MWEAHVVANDKQRCLAGTALRALAESVQKAKAVVEEMKNEVLCSLVYS